MVIHSLIAEYSLQTSWFLNALEDISEAESMIQSSENVNPIKWVAGHLTNSRMILLSVVSGKDANENYKKYFGKGTPGLPDDASPSMETIITDWTRVSEELIKALADIPENQLQSKPPFQTSIPDETLLGFIAYFAIHESFHIGQISVYRKLIGKPSMKMTRR